MEFHGIDSQGEIFIQRAASLPAWAASDQGRLLYAQDTASLYYGTNTQWMPLAGFGSGTRIWFHQNTAPTGWSIVAGLGDRLLAVKGGTQAYNVAGGSYGGTWARPSHTLTESQMPSHRHRQYRQLAEGIEEPALHHVWHGVADGWAVRYTEYTGGGTSHTHGSNTLRYTANVGIVAQKD